MTFERQNRFSTYAGIQYFLLGSLPSARLILAFACFYLQGGVLALQDLDLLFGRFLTTASDFISEQVFFVRTVSRDVFETNLIGSQSASYIEGFSENALFAFNEVNELIS